MRTFKRPTSSTAIVSASVALATLLGASLANATTAAAKSEECREETRRVAVWPSGSPKALQVVRFETKKVTICDGKVVAQADIADKQKE